MKFLLALAVVVAVTGPSVGQVNVQRAGAEKPNFGTPSSYSGNDLYGMCIAAPNFLDEYVLGIVDGDWWESKLHGTPPLNCPPPGVSLMQYGDIVCQYLVNNPAIRTLPAPSIAIAALAGVWSCR